MLQDRVIHAWLLPHEFTMTGWSACGHVEEIDLVAQIVRGKASTDYFKKRTPEFLNSYSFKEIFSS